MIKFVKFFAITMFFLLILTVGSMYLSVLSGEGLVRPVAILFYTIVFFGYGFTLWYVWNKEKQIEIQQAEMEKKMAIEELQKHKEHLENQIQEISKRFEEYEKKIKES